MKKVLTYTLSIIFFLIGGFMAFHSIYYSDFYRNNIDLQGVLASTTGENNKTITLSKTPNPTTSYLQSCQIPLDGSNESSCSIEVSEPQIKVVPGIPYKKDEAINPEIQALSAAVYDPQSGRMLFTKDASSTRPIASISKLMTALVFLDFNPDWNSTYIMANDDRRDGGRIYLFTGDKVKVKDLFYLSLVASDNTATVALAHFTGLTEEDFVSKMNQKAKSMNLNDTKFKDVVGLSNNNVSSARDITKLAEAALNNEEIREATMSSGYSLTTLGGRKVSVESTDYLLKNLPPNGLTVEGGKTGYIDSAGYCFVGKFVDHQKRELIAVVLNSPTLNSRFSETKKIAEWAFNNYSWE